MMELKGVIEPTTTLCGSVNIDPVGVIGKPETPLFDLASIGLPAITPDGVPVELETDTTEILAAVSKGAVVFKLNANLGNEVIPVDVVGSSLCSNVGEEVAFVSCPFVMEELGFVLLSVYPQKIEAVYMPHSMIAGSDGVEEPASINLSEFESDGKIVETYADGSSVTTVMEYDENGRPTKITDSKGNVTDLIGFNMEAGGGGSGGSVTPGQIEAAVESYLEKNPVPPGADGKTPVKGVDYFTEEDKQEIAEQAAEMVEVPEATMKPLTFTGAVNATYDGSEPVNIEIPKGGGGSGTGKWAKVAEIVTTEEVGLFSLDVELSGEVCIFFIAAPTATNDGKKDTLFEINGTKFGYAADSMYDATYYTKRYVMVGHMPEGLVEFGKEFDYSTSDALNESWIPMGEKISRSHHISFNQDGVTNIQFRSYTGVFGIGSKMIVYKKGELQ